MRKFVALALLCFCHSAGALQPPPEPSNHVVFSENQQYKASISAWRETVTIKRVRKWLPDERLWGAKGYLEYLELANNGRFFFTVERQFMMPQRSEKLEVIRVYRSNGTVMSIALDRLIRDKNRMELSLVMGMKLYAWGEITGTEGDWILAKTCEARHLQLNAWTGEVRPAAKRSHSSSKPR